jgi:hypothetical protein
MTSWWSSAAAAMVVLAALGNGVKFFIPVLDQASGIGATAPVDSSIALFDSQRRAVAYLDPDDDHTIYLWSGEPVAYVVDGSIYGFSGKHIGWYQSGVVIDHDGNVVAGPAIAFRKPVQPAPVRSPKSAAPVKAPRESQPQPPSLATSWSDLSVHEFFPLLDAR